MLARAELAASAMTAAAQQLFAQRAIQPAERRLVAFTLCLVLVRNSPRHEPRFEPGCPSLSNRDAEQKKSEVWQEILSFCADRAWGCSAAGTKCSGCARVHATADDGQRFQNRPFRQLSATQLKDSVRLGLGFRRRSGGGRVRRRRRAGSIGA